MTPFENKNSLVKFGYLVATLNLFFFLSLNSNAISSKSAIGWFSTDSYFTLRSYLKKSLYLFLYALTLIFVYQKVALIVHLTLSMTPLRLIITPQFPHSISVAIA